MTLRPLLLSALAAALAAPPALASPQHPVLFLRHVGSDRDDPALTGRFLTSLQAGIEKEFPCARVWNQAQVSDLMERERRCQLQGGAWDTGDCGGLKTVKDIYCGSEYLVATESATGPLGLFYTATLRDVRKVEIIARSSQHAERDAGPAVDALVKDFVHKLARYQLCPYTGIVKMTVSEKTTRNVEEGYGVYCNGDDQRYSRTERDETNANTRWRVEKKSEHGRRYAEGTVEHDELAESSFREEDPCHACAGGRKGPETRTRKSVASARVGEHGSGTAGTAATVELGFEEDGTFRVVMLAQSEVGQKTSRVEEHAEGTCTRLVDTVKRDPPTTLKLGIGGQGVGPFKGSPHDKVLTGADRRVEKIPDGERVVEIEFSLRRD
jgi:hypothetical protein